MHNLFNLYITVILNGSFGCSLLKKQFFYYSKWVIHDSYTLLVDKTMETSKKTAKSHMKRPRMKQNQNDTIRSPESPLWGRLTIRKRSSYCN